MAQVSRVQREREVTMAGGIIIIVNKKYTKDLIADLEEQFQEEICSGGYSSVADKLYVDDVDGMVYEKMISFAQGWSKYLQKTIRR